MIENIIYILLALLGLGFLVFIHELGHYFVARKTGMIVEVFSIGFGKPIYSWKRGTVKWQLCILPFGGYVKIAGMEKTGSLEPYEIKDGFFGKKPLNRVKVAFAGPFANIFFAFFAFCLIWVVGGRDKSFTEYTKKIGYVNPSSEIFKNGVRPGDEITSYRKKPYTGLSDLMYGSVLDEKKQDIEGLKIDYFAGFKTPFEYELTSYKVPSNVGGSLYSIGIESPASFLIFADDGNRLVNSSMKDSGLQKGDRILWASGELLFSTRQLASVLNDNSTFITLQRKGEYLQVKLKKVKLEDVNLNKFEQDEVDDWRHEAELKIGFDDVCFLPYFFNEQGIIERELDFIDENLGKNVLSIDERNPFSKYLEKGDKIIAVDGMKVTSASDILKILQNKYVVIIVQKNGTDDSKISWKEADLYFDNSLNPKKLMDLALNIGTPTEKNKLDNLYLLNPVIPITVEELYSRMGEKHTLLKEISNSEKKINKIENSQIRQEALNELEAVKKELKLGIPFKDKIIKYNPNPFFLFYNTLSDIWKTFSSLIQGNLSPKWMSGPVGIVQVIHHSWSLGFLEALFWLGVISLNLGIINLLPLPVLDGGYIAFSLVEMVTKKPLKAKTMEKLIIPFIVLLIGAILFFTYNDIIRLIKHFF